MGFEPLGARQGHGGGPERAQAIGVKLEDRGALHEVEHAEARGEAGAPRRGKDVVRPRHIVADHLGRVTAEKDRAGVSSRLSTTMTAPKFSQLAPATLARGSVASWALTAATTARPKPASLVIRIDCAAASCSAWARRSAAIQAGSLSLSAMTTTSDGPAIMSMPTWPNTWRLAAAT